MIILDGVDDPGIKACNASIDPEDPPVARATTPSPSLPDYEASQAQLNKEPSSSSPSSSSTPLSRRRKKSRFWRFAIYGLLIYFLLTITIGIPILVTVSFTFFTYNNYPCSQLVSTVEIEIAPRSFLRRLRYIFTIHLAREDYPLPAGGGG